jgi:hypothetical protein
MTLTVLIAGLFLMASLGNLAPGLVKVRCLQLSRPL